MSIARLSLVALSLSSLFCFGGCATLQEDGGRDFQATWPDEVQAPTTTPGAIYAQGTEVSLWQNVTARNVGDTLTIRLAEATNAEKSASTNASKASTAEMTGPTVLGAPVTVNGVPVLEGSVPSAMPVSASRSWISNSGPPTELFLSMPIGKNFWLINPIARVENAWELSLKKAAVRAFWMATS